MSKFNPDLIQKARKGEIAILNDGSVDELRELLRYLWPNDKAQINGDVKWYRKHNRENDLWMTFLDFPNITTHSVKDFIMPDTITDPKSYLTEITKPQDTPRTYKVTRGQMKEIWEAAPIIARQSVRQDAEKMFSVFENEAEITGGDVEVIVKYFFKPIPDLLKSIFPEYFYIPEGEPVLVRFDNDDDWVIRVSDGEGSVYINGQISGSTDTFPQIIPYTKNPPK